MIVMVCSSRLLVTRTPQVGAEQAALKMVFTATE
jgi:hypothetical protein